MGKITKIILLLILGGLLILIRAFEESLFYDPFLYYFKSMGAQTDFPEFESFKLLINLAFRFTLNTLISLAIIYVIFQSKSALKLSAILYLLGFIIFTAIFCVMIFTSEGDHNLTLFYVRRFLIQPLFLLILVPAFYFQKRKS